MAKYLVKANNDVLSHCKCEPAYVGPPAQADCPWCGCGWMLACMSCGKAFLYGRVVEDDLTYEQLGKKYGLDAPRPATWISLPIDWGKEVLAPFRPGQIVVYFDGYILPLDATNLVLEGEFAHHAFEQTPHAIALGSPDEFFRTVRNPEYWYEREREGRLDDQ